MHAVDERSDYSWTVRCDNVPNRQQVVEEAKRQVKLRVSSDPGTRWEFMVAEPAAR